MGVYTAYMYVHACATAQALRVNVCERCALLLVHK